MQVSPIGFTCSDLFLRNDERIRLGVDGTLPKVLAESLQAFLARRKGLELYVGEPSLIRSSLIVGSRKLRELGIELHCPVSRVKKVEVNFAFFRLSEKAIRHFFIELAEFRIEYDGNELSAGLKIPLGRSEEIFYVVYVRRIRKHHDSDRIVDRVPRREGQRISNSIFNTKSRLLFHFLCAVDEMWRDIIADHSRAVLFG